MEPLLTDTKEETPFRKVNLFPLCNGQRIRVNFGVSGDFKDPFYDVVAYLEKKLFFPEGSLFY